MAKRQFYSTVLKNNIDGNGRLKESAADLSDEKKSDEDRVRFVPGLMDLMFD